MFNLFGKKSNTVKVDDKVWMSSKAKWEACREMLAANASCLFVAWFPQTKDELCNQLGLPADQRSVILAETLPATGSKSRLVIFVEHHPLLKTEQALFHKLNMKEVPVLVALDEPFFEKFGGSKTIELMKKLGVKENEILSHAMIAKSIMRAQEKIEAKVKMEKIANSQREWMHINLNGGQA